MAATTRRADTTGKTSAAGQPPAPKAPAASVQPNDPDAEFWARLTAPFADDEIELLPKPFRKDSDKGTCTQPDRNGESCGGYHGLPAVHLSYVGHAGITTRLNDVCGPAGWGWEPFALSPEGLPLGSNAGLWITLWVKTPSGQTVSRIGFGDAPGKSNATKELIGDALRNAAMRFGVGTYLWSKSDRAKGLLARGDAETQSPGQEDRQQDAWETAQPRQQARGQAAAGQENQDPEPPVWLVPMNARISALEDSQKSWLLAAWKDQGWPKVADLTAAQAEAADMMIRQVTGAQANPFG